MYVAVAVARLGYSCREEGTMGGYRKRDAENRPECTGVLG